MDVCVSVAMHAKKITNGCVCVCLGVRGENHLRIQTYTC